LIAIINALHVESSIIVLEQDKNVNFLSPTSSTKCILCINRYWV